MKFLDRVLQRWRIEKARPFIPPGSWVLDVGCADGMLFKQLGARIAGGVGIDPDLPVDTKVGSISILKGHFPDALREPQRFDAITMLAVLEHIPPADYEALGKACAQNLRQGGRLIITVPCAAVDRVLSVLSTLRLIDGMSLEQHHGFDVNVTPTIFSPSNLQLIHRSAFQLGLNNLFVFELDHTSTGQVSPDLH